MTGEQLCLERELADHWTWRISIVAILLGLLALFTLVGYGCRQVQRCPTGAALRTSCGMAMTSECIMAMRKNCQ